MKRALIGATIAAVSSLALFSFGGNGSDAVAAPLPPPPPPPVVAPSMPSSSPTQPLPTPPPASTVPAPVNDVSGLSTLPPSPSLKCKAPKAPTQVKGKHGKLAWRCVRPATTSHKSPGRTE